jgi:hypothetical protein
MDTTFPRRAVAVPFGAAAGLSIGFNGSATIDYLYVTVISSATVGNRQIEARVKDSAGNVIFAMPMGAVQAASLTRNYVGFESAPRETAFVSTSLCFPWPDDVEVPNNGSIQVLDTANVDVNDTVAYAMGVRDDG